MEEEEDLGGCCDGSCREEGARQIALVAIGWWAAHTSRPRVSARIGWGRRGRAEHSCRSFGLPEARVRGRDERRWMICRHGESALQSPNALSSSSDIRPPASPLPRSRQPFRSPPSFFCLRLPLSRVESRLPLFLFVLRGPCSSPSQSLSPYAKRHAFSHRSPPLTGQQPQNLREAYSKRLDRRIPVQSPRQSLHTSTVFLAHVNHHARPLRFRRLVPPCRPCRCAPRSPGWCPPQAHRL